MKNQFLLILFVFLLFGCSGDDFEKYSISDNWFYMPSTMDETIYDVQQKDFYKLDKTVNLQRFTDRDNNFIWLKRDISDEVNKQLKDNTYDLFGIYLNRIYCSDRIFLNDELIGENGSFPPHFFSDWNSQRFYVISADKLRSNVENVLYIQIFVPREGGISGEKLFGPAGIIGEYRDTQEFIHKTINQISFGIMFIIFFFMLMIYIKKKSEKKYLYFALSSLFNSIYLINFFFPSIPGITFYTMPYILFQKIIFISTFVGMFYFIMFIKEFFKLSNNLFFKVVAYSQIIPIVMIITPHDYHNFRVFLGISQVFYLIPLAYAIINLISNVFLKSKYSLIILSGLSPTVLTIIIDVGIRFFPGLENFMFFSHYGITILILSILYCIAVDFSDSLKKIRVLNDYLEEKVSERTKKLKESNLEKTRYFINIAHETKTPLTLIKNYFENYLESHLNDPDLLIVKENIDKLLRDMVNYLDYEKLSNNKVFYNHSAPVNLSEIIEKKVFLFEKAARLKSVEIKREIEKDCIINADIFAIDRIINNIMDNAVKFTNKGCITVTLQKTENKERPVCLKISDTGTGIDEKDIQYIFDPFYQLSKKSRNIHGIGMGLAIVKKIIDELDGDISIKSKINEGTEFIIEFMAALETDKNYALSLNYNGEDYNLSKPINLQTQYNVYDIKDKDSPTIMIVEDNYQMMYYLWKELKNDYNIITASDGINALLKLESSNVDLIISDIMMDNMNGISLCTQINDKNLEIPLIFLTAKDQEDERIKCLKMGAIDYIVKPFVKEELIIKTKRILEQNSKIEKKIFNTLQNNIHKVISSSNDISEQIVIPEDRRIAEISDRFNLSERETQMLRFIIHGLFNKEISGELNISIRTVEHHLHNLYKKLDVKSKSELVNFFHNI